MFERQREPYDLFPPDPGRFADFRISCFEPVTHHRPGSGISMPEGYADDPSVVPPGTVWPDPRDVRRSGGTDRHFGFA